MTDSAYRITGLLYIAAGAPATIALAVGNMQRGGEPYFALSIVGVPIGALYLLFWRRPERRTKLTDHAVRLGMFTLLQILFAWVFKGITAAGYEKFLTAYWFMAMFASFLSLFAAALLISAFVKDRPAP